MRARTDTDTPPLNIRIKVEQRRLIESAARAVDKTVSDFVRDAAIHEAQNALLDQTSIHFTDAAWKKFTAALDATPGNNPRLQDLMSRKPVWEE